VHFVGLHYITLHVTENLKNYYTLINAVSELLILLHKNNGVTEKVLDEEARFAVNLRQILGAL
jgi:hypothetical protein